MSENDTLAPEPAPTAAPMSQRVAKSAVWTMAANASRIASAILILPVLTRLLTPEDFGLMQIAAPFLFFVMVFSDLGMQPALVVAEKPSTALWSTAFWTGLGVASLLTLGLIAAAPVISIFFNEPRATPILQVLAITILIGGFAIVPAAQLMRAMDFRTLAIVECFSVLSGIIAAVICAFQGWGVWSLVVQQLVMFSLKSASLFIRSPPPIRFQFSMVELKSIIGVSWQLTNVRMVNFLTRSVDLVIIGRFLGAAALGFYSIAWRIVMMPIEILATGMTQVLLPALGQIKDEPERVRNGILRTYRTISLLSFPAIAGISSLSFPLTHIAFGDAFMPAAIPVSILAMLGAIQSLLCIQGPIFIAFGRIDLLLRWSLITAATVASFLLFGVRWGLEGAVIGSLLAGVVCGIPNLRDLLKLFDARLVDAWAAVQTPALLSLAMGLIVFTLSHVVLEGWGDLEKLAICIPAGMILYGGGLVLLDRKAIHDVLMLGRSVLAKAPA
ncbi:MAG: lipopolysaccharide biosynthesis protein [Hyphomonas sp.]